MALFKKNPNETAYVGGKKHWTDVIKNSGAGDLLIWRQPEEDFNTNSTLVVMPGESAIFVNGGVIEQVFESGTYKLSTENYPFISRLRNAFSGGISTFNCVVYFVRTAHSMEILWGTPTPIQVRDPVHKIFCSVQARGAYKVQVSDPSKFLMYMIGNNVSSVNQEDLRKYFGSQMMMYIKSYITQFINSSQAEILGICAYQIEISIILEPFISKTIESYGLRLVNFSIESMDIPENDPHRFQLESAFALSGEMRVLGEDWARAKAADILADLAKNPGAGGVAAMGAGMGMGMAAAPVFSSIAQQMFGTVTPAQQEVVSQTSTSAADRFKTKNQTDNKVAEAKQSFTESLEKLKTMRDLGVITQAQFDEKIKEIMDRM